MKNLESLNETVKEAIFEAEAGSADFPIRGNFALDDLTSIVEEGFVVDPYVPDAKHVADETGVVGYGFDPEAVAKRLAEGAEVPKEKIRWGWAAQDVNVKTEDEMCSVHTTSGKVFHVMLVTAP